ncbi:MAG: hypothetical protein P8Z75_10615 [Gammaproteobacteria bacterium]
MNKSDHLSGYAEWVTQTAVSLTPEQLHMNKLVVLGLHFPTDVAAGDLIVTLIASTGLSLI